MKRCLLISALLLISVLPLSFSYAQSPSLLVIRSVGVWDVDGTILYSVLVASGSDELIDVTITSTVPDGTTFVEVVTTPENASFVGEVGGVVTWQLKQLEADTIVGPFTYRVNREKDTMLLPLGPSAQAIWAEPETGMVAVEATEAELRQLADSGTIRFDERGTVNENGDNTAIPVGETGIIIFIPSGVVNESVEMTLTRLMVAPDLLLPNSNNLWWCAVFSVTLEPQIVLPANAPIILSMPSRKTISPGQPALISVGNQSEDGGLYIWQPLADSKAEGAFIGPDGSSVIVVHPTLWGGQLPQFIALGTTNPPFRPVSGASLGFNIKDGTSNITDGTSNTRVPSAQSYIEQDNIIAILIG